MGFTEQVNLNPDQSFHASVGSGESFPKHVQQVDHVLIGGKVLFYHEKAPFPASGFSIAGGLEYDDQHDSVKCHECGEFHRYLPNHIRAKHSLSAREYKERHGLNLSSSLVSEQIRSRMVLASQGRITKGRVLNPKAGQNAKGKSYRKSAESQNAGNQCTMQLLDRIQQVAEAVQRTPTQSDLTESGVPLSVLYNRFGSLPNAMKLAGLVPRGQYAAKYTRNVLLELFVNAYRRLGRCPSCSDARRGLLPSTSSYRRYWSSWAKVAIDAGFEPNQSCNPNYRRNGKKTCPRGHPKNEANTYVPRSGNKTFCRICRREDARNRRNGGKAA